MKARTKQNPENKTVVPKQVDEEVCPSYGTSLSVKADKGRMRQRSGSGNTQKQPVESKARLEARVNASVLAQIKRAAEIQGRTVTDFVIHAALDAATKAIEDNHIVNLSLEGQTAFAEALLNPPEPGAALRRAFKRHEQLLGKNA